MSVMAQRWGFAGKHKLWNPKFGIRFSPLPERAPAYPSLDMVRFGQTASASNVAETHSTDESLDDSEIAIVKDDLAALLRWPHATSTAGGRFPAEAPIVSAGAQSQQASHHDSHESKKAATSGVESEGDAEEIKPPSTTLHFNISHELFHAARAAEAGSFKSFWSHTMYQRTGEDGNIEEVKVHYCTSRHTMEQVCKRHFLGQDVLGFDLEWLPYASRGSGVRENVSLIQIASPSRIGLFHVAVFDKGDELISPTFRQIMEDPSVSKVGVQIQGDCTRLKNYLGLQAQGIFELSHLYKQVTYTAAKTPKLINKVPVALSTQVLNVLKLPLFKGDIVRSSNWMKRLNYRQLLCKTDTKSLSHAHMAKFTPDSASDAYAGIQLYHALETKRKELEPCPPRPHHAELGLPIPTVEPGPVSDPEKQSVGDESDDSFSSLDSDIETELLNLSSPSTPTPPRDPRIVTAEDKVTEYRTSRQVVSAQPAALRAYYIWYNNTGLEPEAIAKMLRDPPLKTNTVVSYILDAIVNEKMPHDKRRLKSEVLPLLDQRVRVGNRYGALVRSCEKD
jgi:hypothetical protein